MANGSGAWHDHAMDDGHDARRADMPSGVGFGTRNGNTLRLELDDKSVTQTIFGTQGLAHGGRPFACSSKNFKCPATGTWPRDG